MSRAAAGSSSRARQPGAAAGRNSRAQKPGAEIFAQTLQLAIKAKLELDVHGFACILGALMQREAPSAEKQTEKKKTKFRNSFYFIFSFSQNILFEATNNK